MNSCSLEFVLILRRSSEISFRAFYLMYLMLHLKSYSSSLKVMNSQKHQNSSVRNDSFAVIKILVNIQNTALT